MERASRRRIHRIRKRKAEPDVGNTEARFRRQHTCEQRLRIRMQRRTEKLIGIRLLDEGSSRAAELRDEDETADAAPDAAMGSIADKLRGALGKR